jgi:hypothetical protein
MRATVNLSVLLLALAAWAAAAPGAPGSQPDVMKGTSPPFFFAFFFYFYLIFYLLLCGGRFFLTRVVFFSQIPTQLLTGKVGARGRAAFPSSPSKTSKFPPTLSCDIKARVTPISISISGLAPYFFFGGKREKCGRWTIVRVLVCLVILVLASFSLVCCRERISSAYYFV